MNDYLKPLPKDDGRDLRVGALYTLPALTSIPEEFEFNIPESWYETQTEDTCAKESSEQIVSFLNKVRVDGLFTWVLARTREGYDINAFGLDLRSMLMGYVRFGALLHYQSPLHNSDPRDTYADITKWDVKSLLSLAGEQMAGSAIMITPTQGSDLFDTIKRTAWKFKAPVVIGLRWGFDMSNPNLEFPVEGTGHAVLIKGWRKGKFECVILNSYGLTVGDKGKFYATREIINHDGNIFGAGTLTDASATQLKAARDGGYRMDEVSYRSIIKPF